jgi:hypothetical protein
VDIPIYTNTKSIELEENSIKVSFSPEMKVVDYNIEWLEMNAYDTGLSLLLQGEPLNHMEVVEFEKNPNLDQIIAVRYLDDAGKHADMETPDYWYFAPMVQRMVNCRK